MKNYFKDLPTELVKDYKFVTNTTYYFGEKALDGIEEQVKKHKLSSVLLVFDDFIKTTGIVDKVADKLKAAGVKVTEKGGVQPNPDITDITAGVEVARKCNAQAVFGIGGGSSMDSSKVIASIAPSTNITNNWEYMCGTQKTSKPALKVFTVPTIASTGSESNGTFVVTNRVTQQKNALRDASATPLASFMNPAFTQSVPEYHTFSGIADAITHSIEQYYNKGLFNWTRHMIIGNIKALIDAAKDLRVDLTDYEARANALWGATMALNGNNTQSGHAGFNGIKGDWGSHRLQHALGAKYNIVHGYGVATVMPTWMEVLSAKDENFKKATILLGNDLFGSTTVEDTISEFKKLFFDLLGAPAKITEYKEIPNSLSDKELEELADIYWNAGPGFSWYTLDRAASLEILKELV